LVKKGSGSSRWKPTSFRQV